MVKNRDSIRSLGEALSDLVISGGANTARAVEIANKLNRLCREGGAYQKRYEDAEERILMRHLNLYKNKRNKAVTNVERARWQGKIIEQEAKIAAFRSGRDADDDMDETALPHIETDDLDLDGL